MYLFSPICFSCFLFAFRASFALSFFPPLSPENLFGFNHDLISMYLQARLANGLSAAVRGTMTRSIFRKRGFMLRWTRTCCCAIALAAYPLIGSILCFLSLSVFPRILS